MNNTLSLAVANTCWAILPNKLAMIVEIARRHDAGETLSRAEIAEIVAAARKPAMTGGAGVAVLPLYGTIIPRGNLVEESSGALSAERFGQMFDEAMSNPSVSTIIIDADSPGGAAHGMAELSDKIYNARGQGKRIIAIANHLAASAAYWIISAADEVVVSPSGEVGSVGVFTVHTDISKALESEGVVNTIISEGKYKVEGNPYEPLSDEARASIQGRINGYYAMFTKTIARNRGVSVDTVRNGYGEGRVVGAKQAKELGMVDRIATLEQMIDRFANGGRLRKPAASAEADLDYRQRRARAESV